MIIKLILDETHEKNLKALLKRYGGKAPEYFRILLKEAYTAEFGKYLAKDDTVMEEIKKEEELTPEQLCEKFGGVVGKGDNGTIVAIFRHENGGLYMEVPLEKPELFKGAAKRMGIIK